MKNIKTQIKILFILPLFLLSPVSQAFEKSDIMTIDTSMDIKQERWPDWGVKYRVSGPLSLNQKNLPRAGSSSHHSGSSTYNNENPFLRDAENKTKAVEAKSLKFEMSYPLSYQWKGGFEFTIPIPSDYKGVQSSVEFSDTVDIYDFTLTRSFNVFRGASPLFAYLKLSGGLSLARLSLSTLARNCPSLSSEENLKNNEEKLVNLLMAGYVGGNVGAVLGVDWYFHRWVAFSFEAGYRQHALVYHSFVDEKLFPYQAEIAFGLKTIF